ITHRWRHPGPQKSSAWSPLLLEAVFIVLVGVFGKYHDEADAAVWGNATGQLKKSEIKCGQFIVQNYPTDFACATVLISFGALLGRISALQCLALAMIEIPIFVANEYVGFEQAVDMGGSMFVHIFGAYFGIAASRTMAKKADGDNCNDGSRYHNDLFAMIGTIFLWLYWPSFNAGLAVGDDKHRAVINTYLSLAACTLVAFAVSSLFEKGKLEMVHIQCHPGWRSGRTVSDMMIKPYGAVIIGSLAGVLSVFGYAFLAKRLRANNFLDTCGLFFLQTAPPPSLYQIFPARAPKMANGSFTFTLKDGEQAIADGEGRTAGMQAAYQAAAASMTLLCAIMGGLLTGFVLRLPFLDNVPTADFFLDNPVWNVPEDYDGKQHRPKRREGSRASGDAGAASALIATGDGKQRDEAEEGV
uniref:Ammonium_transp domain-containing protein n=1 Tax=Macrostomum lignano TaxID=282301 RepID=A0A1I8FIC8_9PLAT